MNKQEMIEDLKTLEQFDRNLKNHSDIDPIVLEILKSSIEDLKKRIAK